MLGNPSARVVYYDYLGLDYRSLASNMMLVKNDIKEFSDEYFDLWKKKRNIAETDKCLFLISQANKYFLLALNETKEDIIWDGYIRYNLTRTHIMSFLFMSPKDQRKKYREIVNDLDDCVKARENICFMFSKEGFLQMKFEEEKKRALQLRKNFKKAFNTR